MDGALQTFDQLNGHQCQCVGYSQFVPVLFWFIFLEFGAINLLNLSATFCQRSASFVKYNRLRDLFPNSTLVVYNVAVLWNCRDACGSITGGQGQERDPAAFWTTLWNEESSQCLVTFTWANTDVSRKATIISTEGRFCPVRLNAFHKN